MEQLVYKPSPLATILIYICHKIHAPFGIFRDFLSTYTLLHMLQNGQLSYGNGQSICPNPDELMDQQGN